MNNKQMNQFKSPNKRSASGSPVILKKSGPHEDKRRKEKYKQDYKRLGD